MTTPLHRNTAPPAGDALEAPGPLLMPLDRLGQDPAAWRRFELHGARRWFYQVPGHTPGPTVAAAA